MFVTWELKRTNRIILAETKIKELHERPKLEWNEYCDKNRSEVSEIWNIVRDMGDSSVPFTLVDRIIIISGFTGVVTLVALILSQGWFL
jgi:hypothetical protein